MIFYRIKNAINNIIKDNLPSKYKWPKCLIKQRIEKAYFAIFGYSINWKEPSFFTEKVQWYKLYYKNPLVRRIIDKGEFKTYIEEKIGEGHTIPLIDIWNDISDFERAWPYLPKSFCLKSTISGGGNNILLIRDKSVEDYKKVKNEVSKWFDPKNTNLNSTITAYYKCKPRVLAEEYMTQTNDQLYDYKFFCFMGVPHYVYVATDHFPGQLSHISFYDLDWNKLDVKYGKHPNCNVKKPKNFNQMLSYAKTLSEGFPFVRVDFFETEENLYIAELTFFPGNGFTPYHPESFNKELGDLFILPKQ
ncbi:MAG: hypothetical protein IKQ27_00135 [Lachnospiraceae bacterium]|nr:hypothetical protein [Lachnospiraceae bacterium]